MAIHPRKLMALAKEGKQNPHDASDESASEHAEEDEDEQDENDEDEDGEDENLDEIVEKAAERVDNGGDEKLMELIEGYEPEDGDNNPPEWVVDAAKWEKAKGAVKKAWDDYDEPWAVVVHAYQQMGGKNK